MSKKLKNNAIKFVIPVLVFVTILVSVVTIVTFNSGKTFRLDDEYYGASEAIDIDADGYEQLIKDKKSFVIMVDKPQCYTTTNMREWMTNFPEKFKYYRIMLEELQQSSLHEKVKYVPSLALIRKGEVVDFLDADAEEDVPMYNNADSLREWIKEHVEFDD
jgi:hypothetical protein